ncbi:hypothetical protein, partial [Xanthomonas oryzae]
SVAWMPPHSEQIVSRICGALFRGSLSDDTISAGIDPEPDTIPTRTDPFNTNYKLPVERYIGELKKMKIR